jgi:hypothetical protein
MGLPSDAGSEETERDWEKASDAAQAAMKMKRMNVEDRVACLLRKRRFKWHLRNLKLRATIMNLHPDAGYELQK